MLASFRSVLFFVFLSFEAVRNAHIQTEGYIYKSGFNIQDLLSLDYYSNDEMLIHTKNSVYLAPTNNISIVSDKIGDRVSSLGFQVENKEFYLGTNQSINFISKAEGQAKFYIYPPNFLGNAVINKDNTLIYTTNLYKTIEKYDISKGTVDKTIEIQLKFDYGAQMNWNEDKTILAVVDPPYFFVLDPEMNIIYRDESEDESFPYQINIYEKSELIKSVSYSQLNIRLFNESSKEYPIILSIPRPEISKCNEEKKTCSFFYSYGENYNIVKLAFNLIPEKQRNISQLSVEKSFNKLIGQRLIYSTNSDYTEIEVTSFQSREFKSIQKHEITIKSNEDDQVIYVTYSEDGSDAYYVVSRNSTSIFAIRDIRSNQLVCQQTLGQNLSNYKPKKAVIDHQTDILYLFDQATLLSLNTTNCQQISLFKNSRLGLDELFYLQSSKKLYIRQWYPEKEFLQFHYLTLKFIKSYNQTSTYYTTIVHRNQDKLLGYYRLQRKDYLVLFDMNFQPEKTIQFFSLYDSLFGIQLTSSKKHIRVQIYLEHIIFDSDSFEIISNYLSQSTSESKSIIETYTEELYIYKWKYLVEGKSSINRSLLVYAQIAQKNRSIQRGFNAWLNQSVFLSLQFNSQTKGYEIIKSVIKQDQIFDTDKYILQICENQMFESIKQSCDKKFILWSVSCGSFGVINIFNIEKFKLVYKKVISNYIYPFSFYLNCSSFLFYKNDFRKFQVINLQNSLGATIKSDNIIQLGQTICISNKGDIFVIQGKNSRQETVVEYWNKNNFKSRSICTLPDSAQPIKKMQFSPKDTFFVLLKGKKLLQIYSTTFELLKDGIIQFEWVNQTAMMVLDQIGVTDWIHFDNTKSSSLKSNGGLLLNNFALSPSKNIFIGQIKSSNSILIQNKQNPILNQTIKTSLQKLDRLIANDKGSIFLLGIQQNKIEYWSYGYCQGDLILTQGFCVCPPESVLQESNKCKCINPLKKVVESQCQCVEGYLQIKGQCCPSYSIDVVQNVCICSEKRILTPLGCQCTKGYLSVKDQCCPSYSIDVVQNVCICSEKRILTPLGCQCTKGYLSVKDQCCPNYSVDFIDGQCICGPNRVLTNEVCLCISGYQEKGDTCSKVDSGPQIWVFIIIGSITTVLVIVVIVVLIIRANKKKKKRSILQGSTENDTIRKSSYALID